MGAGEAYCLEYPYAPTCKVPLGWRIWRMGLILTSNIAKACYIAVAAGAAIAALFWVYKYRRRRLIRPLMRLRERLSRRRSVEREV